MGSNSTCWPTWSCSCRLARQVRSKPGARCFSPLRGVLFLQAGLAAQIKAKGGEVPRKVITAPFVQIPLGVTEDRLVGTVDIEASMKVRQ